MAIKAITMDFYGTLVRDNNSVVRDICKRVSQSAVKMIVSPADVGMAWWRTVDEMMHSGTFYDSKTLEKTAIEKIVEEFNSVENPDELYEEVMESLKKPLIYADTATFLDRMPVSFAIIENMDKDILEDALCYSQIEAENIVSSDEVEVYKPSPEIFKEAAKKLGYKPSEILHAGSSIKYDISPAKKVGMKTCWVNRQKKPKKSNIKPDIECASLFDLRMMIK
jgi:2-haloacid dehalogenase/putative hydrolase of the HAD superfamily